MSGPAELAERMREAAQTLREANKVYGYNAEHGVWSPVGLEKEAAVVETVESL